MLGNRAVPQRRPGVFAQNESFSDLANLTAFAVDPRKRASAKREKLSLIHTPSQFNRASHHVPISSIFDQ
jgi:hypothetical protein